MNPAPHRSAEPTSRPIPLAAISARARRWAGRTAVLGGLVGALVGAHLIAAPVASAAGPAIGATYTKYAKVDNVSAAKSVSATCNPGDRVVGGGGWSSDGTVSPRLTLTQLVPYRLLNNTDGYTAAAAETGAGVAGPWQVEVYAVCLVDPNNVWDLTIEGQPPVSSSTAFRTAAGVCPKGKVVFGTGARINQTSGGEVVLQTSRVSGPGEISKAQAQERPGGFAAGWSLTSYAICGKRPAAYAVVFGYSNVPGQGREEPTGAWKTAAASCPVGMRFLSGGGGLTTTVPPNVSLTEVISLAEVRTVTVRAVESVPTSTGWPPLVAHAVCAA